MKLQTKKIVSFVSAMALVAGLALAPQAEAKKLPKLNKKKVTLTVGGKQKLTVKYAKKVKWSIKGKAAKLTSKKKTSAVVVAKKKGSAVVTAKVSKKKLNCKVTVKAIIKPNKSEATKAPENTNTTEPSKAPDTANTAEPSKAPDASNTAEPSKAPEATNTPEPSKDPTTVNTPEPSKAPVAAENVAVKFDAETLKNVNIVAGENGTVEKTADGIVMTAAGGSSGVGIDVRSILPENAEAGSYKSVEVSYKITFADGADTSLFTGGKIALVQDETNLIGTYDDGTNLAYGFPATAFEGSQSLALTNATGKIVGINIQLWNQADWTWPTGLTLTITGIKFAAKPAGTKPAYEKKDFEYEGLNEGAMKAHFESLDPTKTTVAFTFDDGPIGTKEGTAGMVVQEALLAHKATATFNYIGSLYKNNADAKKEILLAKERGFEVANHSMDFNSVTADTVDLIQENRALLKELTGYSNFTFRAPNLSYGYGLNYTDAPVIGVSVDSQDWNKATEDQIYTNVTKNLKDGDIVLMHLNQPTYKVIDKILQFCDDNNIQVCSASELAKLRGVTMKTNTRYDRITAAK